MPDSRDYLREVTYVLWHIALLAASFRCKGEVLARSEIMGLLRRQLPRTVSDMTVFDMKPLLEARYNKS
jgi:hypothetical protein